MSKSSKSEALKKHLGNVVCAKCDSKKHSTKEHKSKSHFADADDKGSKEINGDQD